MFHEADILVPNGVLTARNQSGIHFLIGIANNIDRLLI